MTSFVTWMYFRTDLGKTVRVRFPPQTFAWFSSLELSKRLVPEFIATLAMHDPERGILR